MQFLFLLPRPLGPHIAFVCHCSLSGGTTPPFVCHCGLLGCATIQFVGAAFWGHARFVLATGAFRSCASIFSVLRPFAPHNTSSLRERPFRAALCLFCRSGFGAAHCFVCRHGLFGHATNPFCGRGLMGPCNVFVLCCSGLERPRVTLFVVEAFWSA